MIKLENVSKYYEVRSGLRKIVHDVNLTINKGEKIGVLGRNGSGKSTLIRMIGGAEKPSTGKITREMNVSWPLGFSGAFQGTLTGLDNIRFICRIYGKDIKEATEYVKEFSELGSYLYEPVKSYSSGMKAKLAFAISLTVEFDCYLIDEIVAVGDSRFQEKCRRELFEKRKDRSLIIVSHQVENIRKHCERACVIENGSLLEFANIDDAYKFYDQTIKKPLVY